jgi:hypothetical protein
VSGLSVEGRLAHRRRVRATVGRHSQSFTDICSIFTDHGAFCSKHRRCSVGIQFITVAFIQCDSTLRFEHHRQCVYRFVQRTLQLEDIGLGRMKAYRFTSFRLVRLGGDRTAGIGST